MNEVYSIYDLVSEEHGPLFEAKNPKTAVRQYLQFLEVNKLKPEHYRLDFVGLKDDMLKKSSPVDLKATIEEINSLKGLLKNE